VRLGLVTCPTQGYEMLFCAHFPCDLDLRSVASAWSQHIVVKNLLDRRRCI